MTNDKKNNIVQNTLQKIDGVITALSAYPNIEQALLNEAQKRVNDYLGKFCPTQLDFGKQILEHLVGTDVLINIVSEFIVYELPAVETAIKAALLANMNSLADNCTIDPVIYEKAIKEGIVFDLKQIDLLEKLNVSPLDEKFGQYYYFGTEGCYSAYDVLQSAISPNNLSEKQKTKKAKEGISYLNQTFTNSYGHYFGYRKRDFDCLLWYMKNKAAYREVWGKRTTATEDVFNCTDNIMDWLKYNGSKNSFYYIVDNNNYIILYYYENEWKNEKTSGKVILADTTKKYSFHDGTKNYIYSYGNVSTKKLDRTKYYLRKGTLTEDGEIPLGIYYWNDDKWELFTQKVNEMPKTVSIGEKNVSISDCIDISNDLNENLYLFVDYDLKTDGKTNKELIENGEADKIKSSLDAEWNTGKRTWNKKKREYIFSDEEYIQLNQYDMLYVESSQDENFTQGVDTILVPPMICTNRKKGDYKKAINISEKQQNGSKYTKKFGILTLEYSSRTGNVKQSDGNPMQQQTPYDNVLHVFFGNVKELPDSERSYLQDKIKDSSEANKLGYTLIKNVDTLIKNVHKEIKKGAAIGISQYISFKQYIDVALNGGGITDTIIQFKSKLTGESGIFNDYDAITTKIQEANDIIETGIQNVENFVSNNTYSKLTELLDGYCIKAYVKRIGNFLEANENLLYLSAKNVSYPEAKQNYYYFHTLLEFNVDYVNSLQLFDEKVLAAQLITALFGGIGSLSFTTNLGATASWKREYIRDTVSDMVEKAIAGEDFTVSDCFFTFSNDSYNSMLQATELRQAGLYSKNGEENGNSTINIENILSGLNGIDDAASQTEQISKIQGAISSAADKISQNTYSSKDGSSVNSQFGISISFIESLITNLCTQMVLAVLSPKVYLLILINLQIFGLTTNFDLKSFIENFQNLIRRIIQSIANQFIEYLTERIRQYIEKLASKLVVRISFEQVEMYSRLLKQILQHLKALLNMGGSKMGWAQDIIGLADIKQSINDTEEVINEC